MLLNRFNYFIINLNERTADSNCRKTLKLNASLSFVTQQSFKFEMSNSFHTKKERKISNSKIQIWFLNFSGREGTMGCKLHWYPKIYNYVFLFVVSKTLSTFWLILIVLMCLQFQGNSILSEQVFDYFIQN